MDYPDLSFGFGYSLIILQFISFVLIPFAFMFIPGKSATRGKIASLVLIEVAIWLPLLVLYELEQIPWIVLGKIMVLISMAAMITILYYVRKTTIVVAVIGGILISLAGTGFGYEMGINLDSAQTSAMSSICRDDFWYIYCSLSKYHDKTGKMPAQCDWEQVVIKSTDNHCQPNKVHNDRYVKYVYTGAPIDSDSRKPLVYCQLPVSWRKVVSAQTWVLYTDGEKEKLPGRVSFPPFKASESENKTQF